MYWRGVALNEASCVVKTRIELSGSAPEADKAEEWARTRAREARLSSRAATAFGRHVRDSYHAACEVLVTTRRENPKIRISVENGDLTPRIELVTRDDRED